MSMQDQIYRHMDAVEDFVFDERVAQVFDDMINRSVPGYRTIISSLTPLARRVVPEGGRIYDLGCSLGAGLLTLYAGQPKAEIIGVDNSSAMVAKCREHVPTDIILQQADIYDIALQPCQLVVLNFTLQFIPMQQRLPILQRIAAALQPGGWLVLSEKIKIADPASDEVLIDLHHEFKRSQGYTDLEIARKRQALEKSLLPESGEVHEQRLMSAGFTHVTRWQQQFNFVSWLARV